MSTEVENSDVTSCGAVVDVIDLTLSEERDSEDGSTSNLSMLLARLLKYCNGCIFGCMKRESYNLWIWRDNE